MIRALVFVFIVELLAIACSLGCDQPHAPSYAVVHGQFCAQLRTPSGCPDVWRLTDPDTGAYLYVTHSALAVFPRDAEIHALLEEKQR